MGSISVEGYDVKIKDINALNNSPEALRIGLVYEAMGDSLFGSADGNVSACYIIIGELKRQIKSGSVIVDVVFSTGEERKYTVNRRIVLEGKKDITEVVG